MQIPNNWRRVGELREPSCHSERTNSLSAEKDKTVVKIDYKVSFDSNDNKGQFTSHYCTNMLSHNGKFDLIHYQLLQQSTW